MRLAIVSRAKDLFERMPPRQRQFATAGAIAGAAVGILWLVFALTASDKPAAAAGAAARAADAKPTNVDLMAPGAQVEPVDQWVGTAGRKLAQYENDRGEQQKINRERTEFEQRTMARFADLEKKLTAAPGTAASDAMRTSAPAPAPAPVPAPPPIPAPLPKPQASGGLPNTDLARQGLPPQPGAATQLGAMPPGSPGALPRVYADPAAPPVMMRVTLSPARATAKDGTGAAEGSTAKPQTIDTFLPVSFTRGVLLGGLDAPTGGQSQSNPHPVLIRLSDNSILPNRYRAEYRECFVIASGYGDIGAERAYLRTVSMSCVRVDGTALEVRIEGGVYGEDGKYGMRGRLVTKQGQMLANALLAGVVSGIGQGLSTSNTTYSTTALGQVATTSGSDAFKAGIGSGVGKALDRLAQYYIKLAEQTFPVIEIDAGREIDVVITKGVRVDAGETAKASPASSRRDPADRYLKVNDDEE